MGRRRKIFLFFFIASFALFAACGKKGGGGAGLPKNKANLDDDDNRRNLLDASRINPNAGILGQDLSQITGDPRLIGGPGFDPSGNSHGGLLDPTGAGGAAGGPAGLRKAAGEGSHDGGAGPERGPAGSAGPTGKSASEEGKPAASDSTQKPKFGGPALPIDRVKFEKPEEWEKNLIAKTTPAEGAVGSSGGASHGALDKIRRSVSDYTGLGKLDMPGPKIAEFPSTDPSEMPAYVKACVDSHPDGYSVTVPHVRVADRKHGHFASQAGRVMSIDKSTGRVKVTMQVDLSYPGLSPEAKREEIKKAELDRAAMIEFFSHYGIELDLTFNHDAAATNSLARAFARILPSWAGGRSAMETWTGTLYRDPASGKAPIPLDDRTRALTRLHEFLHMLGNHDEYPGYGAGVSEAEAATYEADSAMKYPFGSPKLYERHLKTILGQLCGK